MTQALETRLAAYLYLEGKVDDCLPEKYRSPTPGIGNGLVYDDAKQNAAGKAVADALLEEARKALEFAQPYVARLRDTESINKALSLIQQYQAKG